MAQLITVMTHLVHVHIKPVEGSTVMDIGETEHVETASRVRKVQADAHTVTVVYSNEHLTRICIHHQEILPQREESSESKCKGSCLCVVFMHACLCAVVFVHVWKYDACMFMSVCVCVCVGGGGR